MSIDLAADLADAIADLPPSAKLVAKVLEHESPLTQAGIAEESRLSQRTVREAVGQLDEVGAISDAVNPRDARQRLYWLPGQGVDLAALREANDADRDADLRADGGTERGPCWMDLTGTQLAALAEVVRQEVTTYPPSGASIWRGLDDRFERDVPYDTVYRALEVVIDHGLVEKDPQADGDLRQNCYESTTHGEILVRRAADHLEYCWEADPTDPQRAVADGDGGGER